MADNRDIEIFCENFRYLRRSRGLTQKQMARLLQISVGYVRRLERGEMPPRMGGGDMHLDLPAFWHPPRQAIFRAPFGN